MNLCRPDMDGWGSSCGVCTTAAAAPPAAGAVLLLVHTDHKGVQLDGSHKRCISNDLQKIWCMSACRTLQMGHRLMTYRE